MKRCAEPALQMQVVAVVKWIVFHVYIGPRLDYPDSIMWRHRVSLERESSLDYPGSVLWRHRLSHTSTRGCNAYFSL